MKQNVLRWLLPALSLAVCVVFCTTLLIYVKPMEDISLDLSLGFSEEAILDDPVEYDEKGWQVCTREGDTATPLTPDGFGGYSGLALGQTFYFSRVLEEALDSPTLQIAPGEAMFSVWLDDTLLYTDAPALDNRIGALTLPMNDRYRPDPIRISLPLDYQGKTLTIAQASPTYMETSRLSVYPAAVHLYCGYAYESSLISESFTTALSAAFLFAAGIVFSLAAVHFCEPNLLFLAISAFLHMTQSLIQTSFFFHYFGTIHNTAVSLLPSVSVAALLLFLSMRADKYRITALLPTLLYFAVVAANGILHILLPHFSVGMVLPKLLHTYLPGWISLFCLTVILFLGCLHWRHSSFFYRIFVPCALVGIILYLPYTVLIAQRGVFFGQLALSLRSGQVTYLCHYLFRPVTAAALLSAAVDVIRTETNRRAEKAAMDEHREMILGSYENMRRQNEEIMKLRHDMISHYEALRGIVGDSAAGAYLDELIGQNKKIRSVIQTGNNMLDIILNNKLNAAAEKGVKTDIVRAEAPQTLPLSDADLCSLVMNIMNNAVFAAANAGVPQPFIRLDIHVRNDHLALTCENSADTGRIRAEEKQMTVPRHGLGRKIIHRIIEQYHGLIDTVSDGETYSVRIAIPLFSETDVNP